MRASDEIHRQTLRENVLLEGWLEQSGPRRPGVRGVATEIALRDGQGLRNNVVAQRGDARGCVGSFASTLGLAGTPDAEASKGPTSYDFLGRSATGVASTLRRGAMKRRRRTRTMGPDADVCANDDSV